MPANRLGRSLAALLLCAIPASARAEPSDVSLHWLTGSVYLVEDTLCDIQTNSLVYVGRSHVTIIGASWSPATARALAAQVKAVTSLPITEVVDTSPDPEWSGGNAYWRSAGARVIAMKVTADLLARTWPATVAGFQAQCVAYPDVPLAMPTDVRAGDFDLQSGAIHVFYTGPSHTAGDVFVYLPNERVLDAGSILKEHLGNMAKADVYAYPATLRKLKDMRLDVALVIAGHWSPVHGADLVDHYLDLLRQEVRERATRNASEHP